MAQNSNIKSLMAKDISNVANVMKGLSKGILTDKQIQYVMTRGAQPLANQMQANYNAIDASDGTVALQFDIKPSRKKVNIVYAGVNKKSKGYQLTHLLEYGSVERVMKKGLRAGNITQKTMSKYKGFGAFTPKAGKSTGVMPAFAFMRKAVVSSRSEVIAKMETEFDAYLTKKVKQLNAKK